MNLAIVFDIDNTLTSPRKPIEPEMVKVLMSCRVPFFLAAGSDLSIQEGQLLEPMHRYGYRGTFDAFLCNGASRYRCTMNDRVRVECIRDFSITGHIGERASTKLLQTVRALLDRSEFQLPPPMRIDGERIIDRGSMINVAPIGRPRGNLSQASYDNRTLFTDYDAKTGYRRRFMAELRQSIAEIPGCEELVITLGGETSFDIVVRGNDKSYAVKTLLDEGHGRVIFIGDALFEGGNDEAILHFIAAWKPGERCPVEAIPVSQWKDTIGELRRLDVIGE